MGTAASATISARMAATSPRMLLMPDGGEIAKNAVDVGVPKGRGVIGRLRSQVSQNQLLSRFPELDQAPDEQEL